MVKKANTTLLIGMKNQIIRFLPGESIKLIHVSSNILRLMYYKIMPQISIRYVKLPILVHFQVLAHAFYVFQHYNNYPTFLFPQ